MVGVGDQFDQPNDKPVVVLEGEQFDDGVTFTGDGWTGTIAGGHFKAEKGTESFDLEHVNRVPPTLGAKPPQGATVLFDGSNMNAWAKMKEKDWLTEDGPSLWHLVPVNALEVVPRTGSLISHKVFGDAKIHVEFRTLGSLAAPGDQLTAVRDLLYAMEADQANLDAFARLVVTAIRRVPSPPISVLFGSAIVGRAR